MTETAKKRATVCFNPVLHRALRIKAAETDRSISELVNEAVKAALAQDTSDIEAFEARQKEPDYAIDDVVADLKRSGKI
jgi:plasmid stability protein